jgi:hypothetical protein
MGVVTAENWTPDQVRADVLGCTPATPLRIPDAEEFPHATSRAWLGGTPKFCRKARVKALSDP